MKENESTAVAEKSAEDRLVALFEDSGSRISTLEKTIADIKQARTAEPKSDDKAPVAEMGESAVAGITKFEIAGVPVGVILVSGGIATFVSELTDGFLNKQNAYIRGLVKLGGAFASVKWGKKFLGKEASAGTAILLGYDGVRDIVPIDTWMKKAAGKVSGTVTNQGLAKSNKDLMVERQYRNRQDIQNQADNVVKNYYDKAGV